MRSYTYQILLLTTVTVVSLLASSDGSNSNAGDAIQSLMNFPPGGQSQWGEPALVGFDSKDAMIKGLGEDDADNSKNAWTELQFQPPPLLAESNNNDDDHGCSSSSRANKKRIRRGNTDYCSPINAPPLHFLGPSSQQEDPQTGSSKKAAEGSPTEPGQQSNPNPQSDGENLLAPPSTSSEENNCPPRYRIPICATTRLEPDPTQPGGWRREPWDESAASEVLFQQDYCRIWNPQARCETESGIEHFMCCRSVKPIVLDSPISIVS